MVFLCWFFSCDSSLSDSLPLFPALIDTTIVGIYFWGSIVSCSQKVLKKSVCIYVVFVHFCKPVVPRCIYLRGQNCHNLLYEAHFFFSVAGCSVSLKVQMWLNMQDGTDCCSLCSSRSNNWGLFSVQPPRIQQHPELHIFLRDSQKTRKRLLTLQML